MEDIKYIIFDFDGTIADTIDLAMHIFNKVAKEFNCEPIKEKDRDLIRSKRPQELLKSFGVTRLQLTSIILRIRKEMSYAIPNMKIVTGINNALREINNSEFRLGILTSNSRDNVKAFLENNDLIDIFDFIYSEKNFFGKKKIINRMLNHEQISKKNVIYVGDETRDIEASKKAGIPVIAVTWGLNDREILAMAQPDQIIDSPDNLLACIKQILNDHFT